MFLIIKNLALAAVCSASLAACTSMGNVGTQAADYTTATGISASTATYVAPPLMTGLYD